MRGGLLYGALPPTGPREELAVMMLSFLDEPSSTIVVRSLLDAGIGLPPREALDEFQAANPVMHERLGLVDKAFQMQSKLSACRGIDCGGCSKVQRSID